MTSAVTSLMVLQSSIFSFVPELNALPAVEKEVETGPGPVRDRSLIEPEQIRVKLTH